MYAPTARRTPTRLPTWGWTLAAALVLLTAFAPAFAAEADKHPRLDASAASTTGFEPLESGRWRLLPLDEALRSALQRRGPAMTGGMLPLAVLPSQRSAWWLGLSASRSSGARVELRWTMPLDGRPPVARTNDE